MATHPRLRNNHMKKPDCCDNPSPSEGKIVDTSAAPTRKPCPACGEKGKSVALVTLKCLLKPQAMPRLAPAEASYFCPKAACSVVYFSATSTFFQEDLLVPVFQKNLAPTTPVCYCFGFSRADLERAREHAQVNEITASISGFVKAGQCACEFRNPQGSCCLGNIANFQSRAGK